VRAASRFVAVFAALLLATSLVAASGLQVSPVSLSLQPRQNAEGLWLSNTGENTVHAQVRVYRWTQDGGADRLTPSRGLIVSPPMLQIAPGDRQLIRVIRPGAPAGGSGAAEEAYRVIVDELPVDAEKRKGLQFVLRYSLPVFIEAAGSASSQPQLRWTLRRDGERAVLEVSNSGDVHAQLAGLQFVDAAGQRTEAHGGLLGYVLPGAQMRWILKPPASVFAGGGSFQVMVNGHMASQDVSLADGPR
jgi:fimbrial chaperone protein